MSDENNVTTGSDGAIGPDRGEDVKPSYVPPVFAAYRWNASSYYMEHDALRFERFTAGGVESWDVTRAEVEEAGPNFSLLQLLRRADHEPYAP